MKDVGVPVGYKSTDVGVIPEDWTIEKLGEKTTKIGSGITPTGGEKVYKSEGRPFLRSQNIRWGYLSLDDIAFIDDEIHNTFKATEIKKLDVFLNITGASIGRSAIADHRVEHGNVNQHVCILRTNQRELNPFFLNCFLLSNKGQKQIDSFQAGGNREGLNFGQLNSFKIPLPPLPEQKTIARVLSDVDELIRECDSLLAKKRDIKQGTMQQLLTGKQRLPGFSGEWEEKTLLKTSTLKARIGWQGLTTKEYLDEGEYFLVTGTDFDNGKIKWNTCHFVKKNRYDQDKNIQLRNNDILITKDGTIGKVAYIDNLPQETTLNSGVFVIRPKNNEYEPLYFYNVLMSEIFDSFLKKLKAGSTISHLYQKDFVNFNFLLPPTLPEQKAIAEILNNMDAEIEALEKKRDKYKAIKQGMMQELLTGKTRIIG